MRAILCLGLMVLSAQTAWSQRDPWLKQRHNMVTKYVAAEGVKSETVLNSMRAVPRHEFVKRTDRNRAYMDMAIAIGYGQTISPPFVVAYMTETIDPQANDKILEIGTGSGYQAAILSGICKNVYSIEIVEGLGKIAAKRLKRLGYNNVTTKIGDGYKGWAEHAPFDKIIVTCSPEKVPKPLIEQLKEGGKMIVPLGQRYQQVFHLFEKKDGKLVSKKLIPTLFVPMTGISEKNRVVKPDPLNPKLLNPGFEDDDNKDAKVDNWHYQRQTTIVAAGKKGKAVQLKNAESGRIAQLLQGMAIDGSKIAKLKFAMWVKPDNIKVGQQRWQRPSINVIFYDRVRKMIRAPTIGPFTETSDWKEYSTTVTVPPNAREMIIRVALNGSTGTLTIDEISMTKVAR